MEEGYGDHGGKRREYLKSTANKAARPLKQTENSAAERLEFRGVFDWGFGERRSRVLMVGGAGVAACTPLATPCFCAAHLLFSFRHSTFRLCKTPFLSHYPHTFRSNRYSRVRNHFLLRPNLATSCCPNLLFHCESNFPSCDGAWLFSRCATARDRSDTLRVGPPPVAPHDHHHSRALLALFVVDLCLSIWAEY